MWIICRKIIITAGNHDSASQMEAYKRLFSKFDIHVVGADSNLNEDWYTDWVVPIYHPSQKHRNLATPIQMKNARTHVFVSAVPFVLEYRLGLRQYNSDIVSQNDLEKAFKKAIRKLYKDLADVAQSKYPNAKLIAMGHLTTLPENDETITEMIEVHRILKDKLTGDVFDPRYRYVALGHIHRIIAYEMVQMLGIVAHQCLALLMRLKMERKEVFIA